MRDNNMLPSERQAARSLGMIYASRMLGLFMIFPIFSLYANDLEGSEPMLVGLALGVYGLTQALLQIPFGMLSDRWGRKPVITAGLIIFALGSVVAANAESIYGVILGRALQGSGAVAAAIMALAADLSREEQRTKMMAILGMSIGGAFMLALVLGPLLASWFALSGVFYLTAGLALISIMLLHFGVPDPVKSTHHSDAQAAPRQLLALLKNADLLRLNLGIFCMHLIITCSFIAFPLILVEMGVASNWHWMVYLPVLVAAVMVMIPLIIAAEAKQQMKPVFLVSIVGLVVAGVLLAIKPSSFLFYFAVVLFFSAFNTLEAVLPSLVSKTAPPDQKGSAMGIYSSSQFFGAFCGGLMGGIIYGQFGVFAIFWLVAGIACFWLLFALSMQVPRQLKSYLINIGVTDQAGAIASAEQLGQIAGVEEVVAVAEEGVAYLKVNPVELDEEALEQLSSHNAVEPDAIHS